MKNFKYFIFSLLCLFGYCFVFAKDEITIEKMIPVYDENSGIVVKEENGVHSVVFNDKDQNVKYNIVLRNNTKRDISLGDIVLPESPEEFFKYEFVGIDEDTVLEPDSTEEVVLSLETVKTEGWGRNFALDLTSKVEIMDNVVNPNTSAQELIVLFFSIIFIAGIVTICLNNRKVSRYVVLVVMFGSLMSVTNAKDPIILPIKLNVSFESQNVMQASNCENAGENTYNCTSFWEYNWYIKNFYFENEFTEIQDYAYKFDVSEDQNEKVIAYLVENEEDAEMFDLHIQADGIIYANEDASYYFADMTYLNNIYNLDGFDTSNVTNMQGMFFFTGNMNDSFSLDLSTFDTSKVTDMSHMFDCTGFINPNFVLDVSNFDTSNVTNMSYMFYSVGHNSTAFTLDVSNFDTSKVTDMSSMFQYAGYTSSIFSLDVSNFDTSNVTDMRGMFYDTAHSSKIFNLDLSNFDTNRVTAFTLMLSGAGYNSTEINTSITISNPDVLSYDSMFYNFVTKDGSKLTVNYTSETSDLVDRMIATKSSNSNVVKGKMIIDVDNLSIGDEVRIENEMFNVISQNDDTVTMLAQYNLGTDYRQNSIINFVAFSDNYGWEYTPGPKEVDIQLYDGGAKTYINEYIKYLKSKVNDSNISGNLITLQELKSLGCSINEDYSMWYDSSCRNSDYIDWIISEECWWTRSAIGSSSTDLFFVNMHGDISADIFLRGMQIRPTITISKNALKDYLKT